MNNTVGNIGVPLHHVNIFSIFAYDNNFKKSRSLFKVKSN